MDGPLYAHILLIFNLVSIVKTTHILECERNFIS
jgi:hypothetical protein